ncbi:MAG: CBS domain-containing protein [Candidatus Paceibacterota bacterium]
MEVIDITKPALTIHEDSTFEETVKAMVAKQTNSLLVVNNEGVLVGEIGMSDILDAIVPEYLDGDSVSTYFADSDMFIKAVSDARDTLVSDFMSTNITTIGAHDSLITVAALAIASGSTHIPVVDADGKPVGIISRRGVKHIIADALGIPDSE